METNALKDNNELCGYLVKMAGYLQENQQAELAELVIQASQFANGSPSEFLHEAQLALERVSKERPLCLLLTQFQDLETVLAQIREAFQKIGGG